MSSHPPVNMITIKDGEEDRELLMSFGLLNEILPLVGDLIRVGLIAIDRELRGEVLNAVLAERNDKGVITAPVEMFTLKISTSDIQRIIMWVQEHLLDFFLEAIENATKAHEPHLDRLKAPVSMLSGAGSPG